MSIGSRKLKNSLIKAHAVNKPKPDTAIKTEKGMKRPSEPYYQYAFLRNLIRAPIKVKALNILHWINKSAAAFKKYGMLTCYYK